MSTKKDKFTFKDKIYMEIALDLAKSREGLTGTNPSVGCVIVKNDNIISIGQTSFEGRPHAELNAIRNSTENLKGAIMYSTLEPCCHHGLTPPCTSAIIKSKISEIVYSILDVDKRVKGKSYKIFKSNKIKVRKGLLKRKIQKFYMPYYFNRKKKLPFVSGKIAIAKNNLIYSKNNSKITNRSSDKFTHFLRYKNDTILISQKTLNQDNPKLNCRLKNLGKFSPKRVILDNRLLSDNKSYIFKTANSKNTIFFYNEAEKSKIKKFKNKNIVIIKSKIDKHKRFDLLKILKKLYNLGSRNILIEGGNNLTKHFLKKRLFNQFYLLRGSKKLSKFSEYIEFNGFNILKNKYKKNFNIDSNFGKNKITLYQ